MRKTTLLLVLLLIASTMMMAYASAEVNSFAPVKQFDCITIKQTCGSCSYVNVSISYPNSSLAAANEEMTSSGGGVWTYNFCETSLLGRYDVAGMGDLEGTETSFDVLYFDVTPSGFNWSISYYILIFILSIGIIVLGYYVQDAWIVILGSFGLILVGLLILFYGLVDMKDTVYTWGLGIITLMLGAYFGIKASLEKMDI